MLTEINPSVPIPPKDLSTKSIKTYSSEVEKYTQVAKQRLRDYQHAFIKSHDSHYSLLEMGKGFREICDMQTELRKVRHIVHQLTSSPEISDIQTKLAELDTLHQQVKSSIDSSYSYVKDVANLYFNEDKTEREDRQAFLDFIDTINLPPSPFYNRNAILADLVARPDKANILSKLLTDYSASALFSTGLSVRSIIELYQTDPALLKKIVESDLLLPSSIKLERLKQFEFVFELKNLMPAEYRPALYKLFDDVSNWSGEGFEGLIPLLKWHQEEAAEGQGTKTLWDGMEKAIALYWKNEEFRQLCPLWFAENKFQTLVDALNSITSIENNEVREVFNRFGLLKKESLELNEHFTLFEHEHPSLLPMATQWINRYHSYLNNRNVPSLTDWKTCIEWAKNHEKKEDITRKLAEISNLPEEKARKVLEMGMVFPFRIEQFAKAAREWEEISIEKLKELIHHNPEMALKILGTNSYPTFREAITVTTTKKNEETLWDDVLKTATYDETSKEFFEKHPEAVEFLKKRMQDSKFHYRNVKVALENNPTICKEIIQRSETATNSQLDLLFRGLEKNPDKYHVKALQAFLKGYPIEQIEQYYQSDSAMDYLLNTNTEEDVQKRTEHIEALSEIMKTGSIKNPEIIFNVLQTNNPLGFAVSRVILQKENEPIQALTRLDAVKDKELLLKIAKEGMTQENRKLLWESTYQLPYPQRDTPSAAAIQPFSFKTAINISDTIQDNNRSQLIGIKSDSSRLQVANEIAIRLLQPDGTIDRGSIRTIRQSKDYSNLPLSQPIKAALDAALNALEEYPEFSFRLAEINKLPAKGTPSDLLLRHMLKKGKNEEISLQEVRFAVLSGLLWPTRQGNIGSCFATGIIIQGEYYPEGIKQKMEDLIMILENNVLSRTTTTPNGKITVTTEYPVFALDIIEEPAYENDHLLCRAREFTYSSMGSTPEESPPLGAIATLEHIFNRLLPSHPELSKEFPIILQEEMNKGIESVFIPSSKNPFSDVLGAWCLRNRKGGAIITSQAELKKALLNILANTHTPLALLHPNNIELEAVFKGLNQWVESVHFMHQSYNVRTNSIYPPLLQLNPTRHQEIKEGPWIQYGKGGSPFDVLSNSFDSKVCNVPIDVSQLDEKEKATQIIEKIQQLPSPIKRLCTLNPEFHLPIGMRWDQGGHAFSLKPAPILDQLKSKDATTLVDNFREEAILFYEKPRDGAFVEILKDNFLKAIPKNSPFDYILSNPQFSEARSLKDCWSIMKKDMIEVGIGIQTQYQYEQIFMRVIAKQLFEEKLPFLNLGDTNWEGITEFGYLVMIDNYQLQSAFASPELSSIEYMNGLGIINYTNIITYHHEFNRIYSKKGES